MSIASSWKRIDNWLRENAPEEIRLPDGADDDLLNEAEERLGVSLPKPMRTSYSLHDGSSRIWIFDQGYLMPLFQPRHLSIQARAVYNEVVDSCSFMREMLNSGAFDDDPGFVSEPDGPVRTDWWHRNWLPITYNESGDHLCLDLSPAKGGKKGQVIDWWHERGATSVVASSLTGLLSMAADRFEAGEFEFDERSRNVKKVST